MSIVNGATSGGLRARQIAVRKLIANHEGEYTELIRAERTLLGLPADPTSTADTAGAWLHADGVAGGLESRHPREAGTMKFWLVVHQSGTITDALEWHEGEDPMMPNGESPFRSGGYTAYLVNVERTVVRKTVVVDKEVVR